MSRYLLVVFLLFSSHAVVADECRNQFVQCVQTTGNPGACQSTYKNCKNTIAAPNPSIEASLQTLTLTPSLYQESGLSMLALQATNSGGSPVQLDKVAYSIRCADQSVEMVEFHLSGPLLPTKRPVRVGQPQVVCLVAGGAVAMASDESQTTGGATLKSTLIYYLKCANGKIQTLTFTPLKAGTYRWTNHQNIRGIINAQSMLDETFIEQACKPYAVPDQSLVDKAIQSLKSYLLDPSTHSPSNSTPSKSIGIGVRG